MTPLPKRKHSTMRVGKRKKAFFKKMKGLVLCTHCNEYKLPHFACPNCKRV